MSESAWFDVDAVGKPHELHRYDAGHGMVVVDQQIEFLAIYIDFAARHLGKRSQSPEPK